MLDETIDAAAARPSAKAFAQFRQVFLAPRRHYFNVAVLSVAHPAAQFEFAGLAVNEPAKAHALHAPLDQKVKNHRQCPPGSVFQMRLPVRNCLIRRREYGDSATSNDRRPDFGRCDQRAGAARATLVLLMVFVLDNYDSFTYNLVQY